MKDGSTQLSDELIARLQGVKRVGVITGAGISADSGIETYRGKGGIYDDPELGDQTIDALSGPTLRVDPERTWRTVAKLALSSAKAKPNAAHIALAELESRVEAVCILTQNVDGLHKLAGSTNVIDIHGDAFDTICMECETRGRLDMRGMETCLERAPVCDCGGVVRPDVVLFGEFLPERKLRAIDSFFHQQLPDLVVSVGTTGLFGYISRPMYSARSGNAVTVDVNPERTVLSEVAEYHLAGRALDCIPALVKAINAETQ